MRKTLLPLVVITVFAIACNTPAKESTKKYSDLLFSRLKGDVVSEQDSTFVIDSLGRIKFDSSVYELSEYKDGNAVGYTDIDTFGRKAVSTCTHFDNGLLKGIVSVLNGKTIYKLDIQLDSAGHYTTAQSYDSTGKMDYFNRDLAINDYGQLTKGKLFKKDSSLVNSFTAEYDSSVYKGGNEYDSTGKLSSKTVAVSNKQGDAIEETTTTYGKKDSTTTKIKKYEYVYDDKDNWVKKTTINEKGKPIKIVKRVFVYAKKEG